MQRRQIGPRAQDLPEWSAPGPSTIWAPALEEIIRYRRLMLVHCCIYYRLDDSVISDHKWQQMAEYLQHLQETYGWRAGFYDQHFENWDASTGYHLPADADVMRVARRTLTHARNAQHAKSSSPRPGNDDGLGRQIQRRPSHKRQSLF